MASKRSNGGEPGYVDDKQALERRLSRIEGQVRGVRGMIDETRTASTCSRSCGIQSALDGVALKLLEDHTGHCVRDAVERGGDEADEKVDELWSRSNASRGPAEIRRRPRPRGPPAWRPPMATPPAVPLPRPVQTARFIARPIPFFERWRRELGETFTARLLGRARWSSSPIPSR